MKSNLKGGALWAAVAVIFFLLVSGCSTIETVSVMPDRQIAIDANDGEWQTWFYEKEKTGTKAAICNDSEFVYICFTTLDADILTQMIQDGFVVWFNSKGNKDKELGINFPFVDRGDEPGGPGGAPPEGGAPPSGGAPPGGGRDSNTVSLAELKVLTSEDDEGTVLDIADAEALGITARMASDPQTGKLTYELRVPLKGGNNRPYVVKASAENVIGVGLMVDAEEGSRVSGISGFGGSMSDMSSGSGMGGGGGGGGGGMGGGGGGGFDSSAAGGFSANDISTMSKIYELIGTDEDVAEMTGEDVSAINAQPGGGGGGMGGGGMDSGMDSGADMGSSMAYTPSSFKIWAKVTLNAF